MVAKISVVTINLNRRAELEATIKSVLAQSYPNLEYLIIDGGSDDGSVEVIERFGSQVHYWVSEPDHGIYDAMNKGSRAATGEWVIFMNSGDRFYDDFAVADIFGVSHDDADLVYGHSYVWYQREGVERFLRAEPPTALALRMNCSHQSLFTRRMLLLSTPFTVGMMVSDYEFLARMYMGGKRFKLVDRVVSMWVNGGISDLNRLRSLVQRWKVANRLGVMPRGGAVSYLGKGLVAISGACLKRVLPLRLTAWILQRRKSGQL